MVSKKTRIGLYVAMFVLLVGFGILNGIVVAGCVPDQRVTAEASAPADLDEPDGGTVEVLSATRVGETAVYHLLVQRAGFSPFSCVMVQESNGMNVGGYVAIDCP